MQVKNCSSCRVLIDVHLDEDHIFIYIRERREFRTDPLAWPAPCCGEIDGDQLATSCGELVIKSAFVASRFTI